MKKVNMMRILIDCHNNEHDYYLDKNIIELDKWEQVIKWNRVYDDTNNPKNSGWYLVKYITHGGQIDWDRMYYSATLKAEQWYYSIDDEIKHITHWAELPKEE